MEKVPLNDNFLGFLALIAVTKAGRGTVPPCKENNLVEIEFFVNGVKIPLKEAAEEYAKRHREAERKEVQEEIGASMSADEMLSGIRDILKEAEEKLLKKVIDTI